MRVFGLWLLYATVGILLLVMIVGGAGGDMDHPTRDSPTRDRTKVLASASGAMFIVAALGFFLLRDPEAIPTWPRVMLFAGVPAGAILSVWSWVWIGRDLKRGGVK